MKTWILAFGLLALVAIAGCAEKGVYEVSLPEQGGQTYVFAQDVRESLKVPINDLQGIQQSVYWSGKINFVFDGSTNDTPVFQIPIVNTVTRLQLFFRNEGRNFGADDFQGYYFIGNLWYNETSQTERPDFGNDVVIWLKGPNTGATANEVMAEGNVIYVSGIDRNGMEMAADRLVLAIFGIESV